MSDLFHIGTSALMTYQKSLSTAAHNAANVNTPGYSRQRVELSTQRPDFVGGAYIGNGVQASAVRRAYDEFVIEQVRTSQSAFKKQETYMEMAQQVDSLLGDTETSLAAGLQDFFNAAQEVADDPSSSVARQVMLSEGQSLASRFHRLDQGLIDLGERVDGQIRTTVDEINSMAAGIADLNDDIAIASSRGGGQPPGDLLDQRDALLEELSQRSAVSLIPQDSGAVNVFVGSGNPLVLENRASTLNAVPQDQDPTHLEITVPGSNGDLVITDRITGGQLGGLLEMRDQVLVPSQNALGRIGLGLASVFNQQQQKGIDLNGELGEDFFTVPQPKVTPYSDNGGPGPVLVSLDDASQLTTDDYQLSFDGTNWSLTQLSDGQPVAFDAGDGTAGDPYTVNGLAIEVDSSAVAGDRYLLQPTHNGASQFAVALTDNTKIAAAGALYTEASDDNTGDAQISEAQVLDASDPNLLEAVSISFDDPPSSYTIDGGASIPYTSDDGIAANGWQIQMTGTPQAGDTFTVSGNQGAVGDNRNALQLAGLQRTLSLADGTASFDDAYGSILADVGTKTRQAQISSQAGEQRLEQAQADRESISGVNLDEEAADMVRFQQAYQAAAQVIVTADTLFESLLSAVRR